MKKISFILIAMLAVTSTLVAFDKDKQDFDSFAVKFYTEMMIAGEQTDELEERYNHLVEYRSDQDSDLYIALENMYIALGSDESATPYQLEVMRLINE